MDIQSIILSGDPDVHLYWWVYLIIMIVMVILSAFFSLSETAFSSSNPAKLKVMIEDRKRGAKKALEMTDKFDKTLTTLLVGNNIVNTGLAIIGGTFFAIFITDGNLADAVATAVITLVLLIFGEIGPKTIAKANPEKAACNVAIIIYVLSIILFPIVIIFVGLQKLLTRNNEAEDTIDEDELGAIIEEMEENGKIEDDEVNMIKNVFTLNDRTAEDIMIPRIKMEAINYNSTLEEVKEFMLDNAYSRIPVYKTDKDHVVGILYERDFFPALVKNPKMSWKKLLRPVKFVSGAMKVDALFSELQASKTHIAIVSGEYGDVLGLVTMEDALEELVGEIYDEHDVPGDNDLVFEEEEDGSFVVDGEWFVEDLFEKLSVGDIPDDVPSKLASWMFAKCESLPEVGFEMQYLARYTMQNEETNDYDDFSKLLTFRIHEVESRRIHLVKVMIRDASEEEIEAFSHEEEE